MKMYKTDNPTTLEKNRILRDPALINYLFAKDVPIYIIRERNNTDNYFGIAGRNIDKELKEYVQNGR